MDKKVSKELLRNLLNQEPNWKINKKMTIKFGMNVAVLFSELKSQEDAFRESNKLDNEGMFSINQETLKKETALTYYQQNKAVKILIKNGFIEVKKKGLPSRYFFRILRED